MHKQQHRSKPKSGQQAAAAGKLKKSIPKSKPSRTTTKSTRTFLTTTVTSTTTTTTATLTSPTTHPHSSVSPITTLNPAPTLTSNSFRSTTAPRKFTRLIDASLSLKNQHAKARASENIKKLKSSINQQNLNSDPNTPPVDPTQNPEFAEFLDDARAKAQRHKSRIERKMRSKDTQHPFSAFNFNITVIGRPNVGKSSLVNRLSGEKTSMVHNSSGVTRDWNHAEASLANLNFQIIDTAGLEEAIIANQSNPNRESDVAFGQAVPALLRSGTSPLVTHKNKKGKTKLNISKSEMTSNYILGRPLTKDLQESMLQLTSGAIKNADIVIFMIDAKQGVTSQDEYFANWIRKQLHSSDQQLENNVDISNFNKYYQLLSEELKNPEKIEMYRSDPTQIPFENIQKLAHIDDMTPILTGTHTDRKFLRSIHSKPVIVLANKYDYGQLQNAKGLNNRVNNSGLENPEDILQQDFDLLGFDDVVPFSAIHGVGVGELYSKLVFSMGKVLKQWDVYQKKVKFIQRIHQDVTDAKEAQDLAKRQEFNRKKREIGQNIFEENQMKNLQKKLNADDDNNDDADKQQQDVEVSYESDAEDEALFQKLIKHNQKHIGNDGDDGDEDDNETVLNYDQDGNLIDPSTSSLTPPTNILEGDDGEKVLMPEVEGDMTNVGKDKEHQVKFVVTGRPNAGKSTLLNALLGEKRLLTGPQPGITRDSIKLDYHDPKLPNHHFQLVDTAGLKGITQHQHSRFDLVDSSAMQSTLKSIQNANVVALVIDIANGLYGNNGVDPVFSAQIQKNFVENVQAGRFDAVYEQAKAKGASDEQLALLKRKHKADKGAYDDKLTMLVSRVAGCVTKHELDIARVVADHGKGLLVIANKIDRLKGGQEEVQSVMKGLLALFSMTYAQNKGVTILPVSALHGTNTQQIMRKVAQLHDRWDSRIGTGVLNRWLAALTQLSPPPKVGQHPLSLKYITQTNTRPPTFALFVNRKTDFPISYERFVRNSLINEFHLQGIPVRLHLRSGKNPYVSADTLSSAERFQIGKKRQRDEILRIKQARGGKNNRQVHAGKISTKGFKAGTASLRSDPQHLERELDKQYAVAQSRSNATVDFNEYDTKGV